MIIETKTTYRCDGCQTEKLAPYGWKSAAPLMFPGGQFAMQTTHRIGEDFCSDCWAKMKAALTTGDRP